MFCRCNFHKFFKEDLNFFQAKKKKKFVTEQGKPIDSQKKKQQTASSRQAQHQAHGKPNRW